MHADIVIKISITYLFLFWIFHVLSTNFSIIYYNPSDLEFSLTMAIRGTYILYVYSFYAIRKKRTDNCVIKRLSKYLSENTYGPMVAYFLVAININLKGRRI